MVKKETAAAGNERETYYGKILEECADSKIKSVCFIPFFKSPKLHVIAHQSIGWVIICTLYTLTRKKRFGVVSGIFWEFISIICALDLFIQVVFIKAMLCIVYIVLWQTLPWLWWTTDFFKTSWLIHFHGGLLVVLFRWPMIVLSAITSNPWGKNTAPLCASRW